MTLDDAVIQYGPESAARDAPDPAGVPQAGPTVFTTTGCTIAAKDGAIPEGVEPLARDIYSTTDFYADRELWSDPRYFRCGSAFALESVNGAYGFPLMAEDTPKENAPWGFCDRDLPREQIVSPYPYTTAQAQYETLLAEAKSRGGPTIHTQETLPDWNGVYGGNGFSAGGGFSAPISRNILDGTGQIPTYLSLLTPEYQTYFVQQMYHYATTNSPQWPGAYCWPEGFLRRWFSGTYHVMMVPEQVHFASYISETISTRVAIGREFEMDGSVPRLSMDVSQWFGDTIGFWDGDILITWTSNVKHWVYHGGLEWSNQMQAVEIYTPMTDKAGKFLGLHHETVLYDPEALVEPVRIVKYWEKSRGLSEGYPFEWRECNQTLFPIDGFQTPANPGETIAFTVPDMNGRPWADIWIPFETNMSRPEVDDVPGFD